MAKVSHFAAPLISGFRRLKSFCIAVLSRGTVKDFAGFDARTDAETLRKAMKGLGTDEEAVLKILTSRSNAQRQQIAAAFKTLFGRDLVDDLKSELTGKFETLMVALMRPARLFDAHELKHAIKVIRELLLAKTVQVPNAKRGFAGRGESGGSTASIGQELRPMGAAEVMPVGRGSVQSCLAVPLPRTHREMLPLPGSRLRTTAELRNVKQVYLEEYEANLEDHVTGDTTGYYQRMLVVLVQANRDPDGRIDEGLVEQDAQVLFKAGELKWGTDEEKFITILGTRSVCHLRKVFDKYMTISGFQIEETIDRETSGDLEKLLLAIVKCVRSVPAYFAESLFYAMKGAGTDDDTLIRIMVSRSEIDLLDIRREFRKNFAKSLHHMIQKDTSGDFRKALLLLCGGDDE
ncbi:Annexin A5 [Chelonia mydas]|uniref:Annexin n=1 Tax=Chelonia mydas TaxID=8469 RepID=M7BS31_CHEMY|nr:Annexin A5 [Chelonia mydas]